MSRSPSNETGGGGGGGGGGRSPLSSSSTNIRTTTTTSTSTNSNSIYIDPVIRDKKYLPYSQSKIKLFFSSLFHVLILFPVCVLILIPLTIIYKLIAWICGLCFRGSSSSGSGTTTNNSNSNSNSSSESAEETQRLLESKPDVERKFDVVLYGATGYTGKLAAYYFAQTYGSTVRWAIAGRRESVLNGLRQDLIKLHPDIEKYLSVVVADSSDPTSLSLMVAATRVVLSTVGPFAKYGTDVVKYCATYGTHYCDITGETDWVRKMIDLYDDTARKSGAKIVHFCGHDCVPWDILTLKCSEELKGRGDELKEIVMYDEILADASGGTLDTVFHSLSNRKVYKSRQGFDPLVRKLDGSRNDANFIVANETFMSFAKDIKKWVGMFVMSAVMANCIRRSNAVNGYSKSLKYRECMVYDSFWAGVINIIQNICLACIIMNPMLSSLSLSFGLLPKPGEGPDETMLQNGFLRVTAIGTGNSGQQVKCSLYFPSDPGYKDTARMLVESGMCIVLAGNHSSSANSIETDGNKCGVLTPASCQGLMLLERLKATGCTFTIQ